MAIKKYTNGLWVPAGRKYGTETDIITSLPVQIIGDGQPITSCQISGNTVQDGTPTPEAPVDVVGCGTWDETHQNYKLPLTVNGTEYPIYLGQVPTTRRIRKLVLTGEENWGLSGNATYRMNIYGVLKTMHNVPFCESYSGQTPVPGYASVNDNCVALHETAQYMYIQDGRYPGLNGFKSYLAAQYAAGTPVTVWYVLAEPETGIVNEPLHKIGGYADTVTVTSIPTTGTPENFDVGTTLKPSEVQLTYHGWHEHADTKYTQGE